MSTAQSEVKEINDTDPFECPMCRKNFLSIAAEGITLQECLHIFCLECVNLHINRSTRTVINCLHSEMPATSNAAVCSGVLQENELRHFLSPYIMQKRFAQPVVVSKLTFNCMSPDCNGSCIVEDKIREFICSVCQQTNCITCQAIHDFASCDKNPANTPTISGANKQHPVSTLFANLLKIHENVDLVSNTNPFACPICLTDYTVGEGITLRGCLHDLCFDCVRNHILNTEDVETRCPFIDDQYRCESVLQEREIKLFLKQDEYEKYARRSLHAAEKTLENTFHCLTPNCKCWGIVENGVQSFICYICNNVYCVSCKVSHDFQTCEESKLTTTVNSQNNDLSEEEIRNRIAAGTAQYCPSCRAVTEKIDGCNQVTCVSCKTNFDFGTGRIRP